MTALALVACSAAGADPATPAPRDTGAPGAGAKDSGARNAAVTGRAGARPPGWKQLPAIAAATAAAAKGDGVAIDRADAWGEPSIGCYAVWLELHGKAGDAPALARQILDGFHQPGVRASQASPPAGSAQASRDDAGRGDAFSISELTMPAGPAGVLAFAFARPPYRGRVRAQLGAGRIAAIACFDNQREPGACDAGCASVLQEVP